MVATDEDRAIARIGKAVKRGRCILFLGAGVHAPPPEGSPFAYPDAQRPPIGSTLSRQLADDCGFAEKFPGENAGNLMRVALAYELATSRGELVDEIEDAVKGGKSPSPALSALAKLDFSLVITTNYDQLFEQALRAAGKEPRVSVYKPVAVETDELLDPTAQSPIIYKLHGDIGERASLVVTDEDYIQFVMRMADKGQYDPIPLSLKAPLTTWSTLFVVEKSQNLSAWDGVWWAMTTVTTVGYARHLTSGARVPPGYRHVLQPLRRRALRVQPRGDSPGSQGRCSGKVARSIEKRSPEGRIRVDGHTDSRGSDTYNDRLSRRRAEAVKRWLVSRGGLAADRVAVRGYGEREPVASNAGDSGRRRNRRVVVGVVGR